MGMVISGPDGLVIEDRRESIYIFDRAARGEEMGDLFAYRSPCAGPSHRMTTVEISKDLLAILVEYLNSNPDILVKR